MTFEHVMPERLTRWMTAAPDWDAVYRAELPRVYNFFRYRLGDVPDVEDLTARTFEKAWRARNRYRSDVAGFATWLMSIARNVATDHIRARRLHLPLEQAEQVYHRLLKMGREVDLVVFHGEPHAVVVAGKPWNRVEHMRYVLDWWDRHLKA